MEIRIIQDLKGFKESCNEFKIRIKEEKSQEIVDQMINFIEENARCSKGHYRKARNTFTYLQGFFEGPFVKKTDILKKIAEAKNSIESFKINKIQVKQIKLSEVREDKKSADFTFFCQDGEVKGHLCILRRLPVFKDLSENWENDFSNKKSFLLPQFSTQSVDLLLDLIYGSPLPEISTELLIIIYCLADFFQLNAIKEALKISFDDRLKKDPNDVVNALIFTYENIKGFSTDSIEDGLHAEMMSTLPFLSIVQEKCQDKIIVQSLSRENILKIAQYLQDLVRRYELLFDLKFEYLLSEKIPIELLIKMYCLSDFFQLDASKEILTITLQDHWKRDPSSMVDAIIFTYENIKGFSTVSKEQEHDPSQIVSTLPFLSVLEEQCHDVSLWLSLPKQKALEIARYLLLGKQKDRFTHYSVSICYDWGIGVEKDNKKAKLPSLKSLAIEQALSLASREGYAPAQYLLAHREQEDEKKIELLKLACTQGYAPAQAELGLYYMKGTHPVEQDKGQGFKLFTLASKQGSVLAQINLGTCYRFGDGVEKDLKQAFELFELASRQGSGIAQYFLGELYSDKGAREKALELFTLASDRGYAPAQYMLGECYKKQRNEAEAIKFYKLASAQGHVPALEEIARIGENCENSGKIDMAIEFYELASDLNQAQDGLYRLGQLYEKGGEIEYVKVKVKKDLEKAKALYTLASEKGHVQAQENLKNLISKINKKKSKGKKRFYLF